MQVSITEARNFIVSDVLPLKSWWRSAELGGGGSQIYSLFYNYYFFFNPVLKQLLSECEPLLLSQQRSFRGETRERESGKRRSLPESVVLSARFIITGA